MVTRKIKEQERMSDKAREWIGTLWPIVSAIVLIVLFQINENFKSSAKAQALESEIKAVVDKNYKLYFQFTEFKRNDKATGDKVSASINALALEVNTLSTIMKGFDSKFASLDDRYPLRKELDTRHFKTAYRTE